MNQSEKPTLKSIKNISRTDEVNNAMRHVFQDAQMGLSGHRKLVIVLKNVFNKSVELNQQEYFALYLTRIINRILSLKKGEQVADRIAKFCASFIRSIVEDEIEAKQNKESDEDKEEDDEDEENESPTTMLITYLIHHLLRGIEAKDKTVRYRVVQLLAYLVRYIGEIDNNTFEALYSSLNKRLNDKEPIVRLQAIVAISHFQVFNFDYTEEESPFEIDITNASITEKIIHSIRHDESAEVRRAALLNLKKSQATIPYLIERARDTNSINRRLVYSRISRELGPMNNIDFKNRELLLKWGLNDREEAVQAAATKMLTTHWYGSVKEDLFELIENLHVKDSDIAETAMLIFFKSREDKLSTIKIDEAYWKQLSIEKAFLMRTFYCYCQDHTLLELVDANFPEAVDLAETLEKYLELRTKFIASNSENIKAWESHNEKLEVFKNQLLQLENTMSRINLETETHKKHLDAADDNLKFLQLEEQVSELNRFHEEQKDNYVPFAEKLQDLEFIILQLLLIANKFDYGDDFGRRKMLQVIRKRLTEDKLPGELASIALKVLKRISLHEKDFIAMSTEIITDIRDSYDNEDEHFHSAVSDFDDDDDDEEEEDEIEQDEDEEAKQKKRNEPKLPPDDIVIQCLTMSQHVLELIEHPLEDYTSLTSIYSGLVNYAINYKEKATLHLLGLKCLGLFALIDRSTAEDAVATLYHSMRSSGEQVRIIGMKAVIDILSIHGVSIIGTNIFSYARLFYKSLTNYDMPGLQCVVAEGLCKLFLTDIFHASSTSNESEEGDNQEYESEKQLFEALILTYFHPLTSKNQELGQILSFCIPVYAFSHPNHQARVSSVSGDVIYRLFSDDEFTHHDHKLSATSVIPQLIFWCDPNNLVNLTQFEIKRQTSHLWQCVYLLQALEQDTSKVVKRAIISNLSKLYLTDKLESTVLKGLAEALEGTKQCFEENATIPEYQLDKLSHKNLDNFIEYVNETYAKSVEREGEEREKSNLLSTNSILGELENELDTQSQHDKSETEENVETNEEETTQDTDKEINEDISDNEESVDVEMQDADDPVDDLKRQQLEENLREIDEILDAEDSVDYSISMEE
ncbi:chromosome condensation complex Condensin, subunit G [Spathaspora passalidarum NRRL Y-27907]|uniref:Chromosome condensation complex Condensin, subunit G n=1 Tax=Spathaspora passalidarum (strain NRRL Y-27907 / 11-Y1) TaxID=619300 RepID=G3AQB5_SPAPN|nr:chromosome condensation complex Condensin, subunit G [Spathaspora passalidarum NRRL Y-27907]EGW31462.1 chromosome condensation complex Condensin, subunit G [Spathaspora passalidarum NRRL Y-27907]